MFTGVFKVRAHARPAALAPAGALASILRSKHLQRHRFVRNGEIGPFVVDYVCRERALILEVLPAGGGAMKQQARCAFLMEMGYRVLQFSRRDLAHPARVLAQIEAALRS